MDTHAQRDFLASVLSLPLAAPSSIRPHVTLTYAQSLDGCIAGIGGKQLILSGRESMLMTHWLRTMHDGILIGIGTALNDDPQLNARHLPARDDPYPLPRPIILDTDLRLPTSSKLLRNYQQRQGRRPWVLCNNVFSQEKTQRKLALEEAGARIIEVPQGPDRHSIDAILTTLSTLGIKSLMVEGGQRVISSFLLHLDAKADHVVDVLIVTVAPTFVGAAGVGALSQGFNSVPSLKHVRSTQFGRDTVTVCRIGRLDFATESTKQFQ